MAEITFDGLFSFGVLTQPGGQKTPVSREEWYRQFARLARTDKGHLCPECSALMHYLSTFGDYVCDCGFGLHKNFIECLSLTEAQPVIVPMDLMSQLKRVLLQNPTHPLTEPIRALIVEYESDND